MDMYDLYNKPGLLDYIKTQIENKELYEWKSRKELENFLLEKKRYCEVIGWVTYKTLSKWKESFDWRGWHVDENMYILQEGNKYFYLVFRKVNQYWRS